LARAGNPDRDLRLPVVIAFGYVVALGPVGFLSIAVRSSSAFDLWNLYSLLR